MDHRAGAMHIKCCGALLVALLAASVALGTTAASAPAGQDAPVVNSNSDSARLAGARFRQLQDPVTVQYANGWEMDGGSQYRFSTNPPSGYYTENELSFAFYSEGRVRVEFQVDSGASALYVKLGEVVWIGYGVDSGFLEGIVGLMTPLVLIYYGTPDDYNGDTGSARLTRLIFEPLFEGICEACALSVGSTDGWAQTGDGLNYGTYTCGQDGTSAVLELGAAVAGQLELDVYVDSEDGVDFLTVHRDGELVYSESGAYKSATLELEVLAGSIVSLTYSKDGSVSSYADTARLTGVRFTPCTICEAATLTVAHGWQATGGPYAFETSIAGQNGESAVLSFEFNQAGRVVLEVFVDSQILRDYLNVRQNEDTVWRQSGPDRRATLELDVSVGTVITLAYSKDSSVHSYSDKAGLSRLVFEPQ